MIFLVTYHEELEAGRVYNYLSAIVTSSSHCLQCLEWPMAVGRPQTHEERHRQEQEKSIGCLIMIGT